MLSKIIRIAQALDVPIAVTKIHIMGLANAGKSTLLNKLLKLPICTTSKLAQTTREQMRYNDPCRSILYIDTPGIVKKQTKIESSLRKAPWRIHSDFLFFIVDATQEKFEAEVIEELTKITIPIYVVYNKMDLVTDEKKLMAFPVPIKQIIKTSAIQNDIKDLTDVLDTLGKPQQTDSIQFLTDQKLCEEIIREQIYQNIYSYLCYIIEQNTVLFEERDGVITMYHELKVQRTGQVKIVKGSQGKLVINMQKLAAKKIESIFNKKVNLKLVVTKK